MSDIRGNEGVNFLGKRGVNASDPVHDKDVVNLRTLKSRLAYISGSTLSGISIVSIGQGYPVYAGLNAGNYEFRSFSAAGPNMLMYCGDTITYALNNNLFISGLTASTITAGTIDAGLYLSAGTPIEQYFDRYWTASTGVNSVVRKGGNHTSSGIHSGVLAGSGNSISGNYSSALNGKLNITLLSGSHSIISGEKNTINSPYSYNTILNSKQSTLSYSKNSVIINGSGNTIDSQYNSIINGINNYINFSNQTVILGGNNHGIQGSDYAIILGGNNNFVGNSYSSILGGTKHQISGAFSSIIGGSGNTVNGGYSAIIGGKNIIVNNNNTVAVPYLRIVNTSAGGTYMLTIDNNGYIFRSSIPGGGVGTVSGATNIGGTHGIYAGSNLGILQFKSLSGGSNIIISSSSTENAIALSPNVVINNLTATTNIFSGTSNLNILFSPTGHTHPLTDITGGNLGDTIRHDGTNWIANNFLYNPGHKIGINNTTDDATFSIKTTGSTTAETAFRITNSSTTNSELFKVFQSGLVEIGDYNSTATPQYFDNNSVTSKLTIMDLTNYGGTPHNNVVFIRGADSNFGSGNTSLKVSQNITGSRDAIAIFEHNNASGDNQLNFHGSLIRAIGGSSFYGFRTGLTVTSIGTVSMGENPKDAYTQLSVFGLPWSNTVGYIIRGFYSGGSEAFYFRNDATVRINSLTGSTTQMVVADSSGILSVQAIPVPGVGGIGTISLGINTGSTHGIYAGLSGSSVLVFKSLSGGSNIIISSSSTENAIALSSNIGINSLTASGNSVFSGTLSGGSSFSANIINSGSTNLYSIFSPLGHKHPLTDITGGNLGDTIRHDGTNWIANNFLYNPGHKIGINNTNLNSTFSIYSTGNTTATTSFLIYNNANERLMSFWANGLMELDALSTFSTTPGTPINSWYEKPIYPSRLFIQDWTDANSTTTGKTVVLIQGQANNQRSGNTALWVRGNVAGSPDAVAVFEHSNPLAAGVFDNSSIIRVIGGAFGVLKTGLTINADCLTAFGSGTVDANSQVLISLQSRTNMSSFNALRLIDNNNDQLFKVRGDAQVTIRSLTGATTQMVVADSSGVLSVQTIPTSGSGGVLTVTNTGSTHGIYAGLSGSSVVVLKSLSGGSNIIISSSSTENAIALSPNIGINSLFVSGNTILSSTTASTLTINSLSGGGTLMVVTDNNGLLSTQTIPSGTGNGTITDAVNTGSTHGIYAGLSGSSVLVFKSLSGGSNIIISSSSTENAIALSSNIGINSLTASGNSVFSGTLSGGSSFSANTIFSGSTNIENLFVLSGQNVGSGLGQIFKQKSNNQLQFKTLSGSGVSIINGVDEITISSPTLPFGSNLWTSGNSGSQSIKANNGTLTVNGNYSIAAGSNNVIYGIYSGILNGKNNTISDYSNFSIIVGGDTNQINENSNYGFIGGGKQNQIQYSTQSAIGGGISNKIIGFNSENVKYGNIIGGGNYNSIYSSDNSVIAGGKRNLIGNRVETNIYNYSFIGGGSGNTILNNYSVIGGGKKNIIYTSHGTIINGLNNKITKEDREIFNIIGSGKNNLIHNSTYSTILNGYNNYLNSCDFSSILGGSNHTVSANYSTIIGGNGYTLSTPNTVLVPRLNIQNISNGGDYFLTRNSANGFVYQTPISSFSPVRITNGLNTYTGGTITSPSVNVSALTINTLIASGNSVFSGQLSASTLTANTITATTISASTLAVNGVLNQNQFAYLSTPFSTTSTSLTDVTGMSFTIQPFEVWQFEISGQMSGNTLNGQNHAISVPTGAILRAKDFSNTNAVTSFRTTALNSSNVQSSTVGTNSNILLMFELKGLVSGSSTAGNVQFRLKAGTAGDTETIQDGTYLIANRIK